MLHLTMPVKSSQKRNTRPKRPTTWESFKHSFITTLIFAITAFALWVLLLMLKHFIGFDLLQWFSSLPIVAPLAKYIVGQVGQKSFEGIVYAFSFSSLFFIPTPLEVLFLGFLRGVRNSTAVIVPAFVGLMLGQNVNFFLGRIFGKVSKKYISASTRKKIITRLNEYGAIAIFFINLLPLPYPITNFLAGSLKYPYKKWLLFSSLAIATKLVFIAWLYVVVF